MVSKHQLHLSGKTPWENENSGGSRRFNLKTLCILISSTDHLDKNWKDIINTKIY